MRRFLLFILSNVLISLVYADVFSYKDGLNYYLNIQLSTQGDQVQFQECRKISDGYDCQRLGQSTYYSKTSLMVAKTFEYQDIQAAAMVDLGLVAGGIYLGTLTGSLIGYQMAASSMPLFYFETGALVGAGVGIALTQIFDQINPIEQFLQFHVIDDSLLNDELLMTNFKMKNYIKRIKMILENLDNSRWMVYHQHQWINIKLLK